MAKYLNYLLVYSFLSVLSLHNVITTESVPVVFWNIDTHKNVPALQHVGKKYFRDIVQTYVKDEPFVIVFEDENLSTEDFTSRDTSGRNVFGTFNKLIEDEKISYMPSVQSPLHVLLNLAAKSKVELKASDIRSGESQLPKPAAGQYVFIHLDEANDDEDRPHLLKRHVKFMADVYQKVQNQYPKTLAIYTAERPSWYVPSMNPIRRRRNLLETEQQVDQNAITFFDENIRIFSETPYLIGEDKKKQTLQDLTFSSKKNGTSQIEVTASTKDNETILGLLFTKAAGYWYLISVTVNKTDSSDTIRAKEIAAPFGFSYHCNELKISNKKITIGFPKAQFQPNFNSNSTPAPTAFGDAYDCVGFTSIPIWSGLFVTFILAMIMTLGLTMMMDIKTMDRFDDPKGKGVTINVVE
ncbi:V-type proton ATPase subunit S1 [Chrysoperla carnea]|uniref:V-type proton ATPase subunit S1 n=1 Tax=Chrysoperla carnea TaxID=189513 RepID=UPI001D071838|nr:V-type proton ATPase subunit S1 [Chrysoperla carnea]